MIYDLPPAQKHRRFDRDGFYVSHDDERNPVVQDGQGIRVELTMMDSAERGSAGVTDNARAQMAADTAAALTDAQSARAQMVADLGTAWAPPSMRAPRSRPAGVSPLQWRAPPVTDVAARDAAAGTRFAARAVALDELNGELSNAWRGGR